MKKLILLIVFAVALSTAPVFAQSSYKNALGLGIDFGDGATEVGPSFKHFFNSNEAAQIDLLFSDHVTWLGGYYQYHQSFKEEKALRWYLGIGPQFGFFDGGTVINIKPMAGLEYKFPAAPFSLSFDWRPDVRLNYGSGFEAARFGLGFRYSFN